MDHTKLTDAEKELIEENGKLRAENILLSRILHSTIRALRGFSTLINMTSDAIEEKTAQSGEEK